MTDGKLYLAGTWTEGAGDGFASFDPATEARVWRGNEASVSQVGMAVQAAREAAPRLLVDRDDLGHVKWSLQDWG